MSKEFEYRMKVRYYECDTQGVVNHANYLHYFETARLEMMVACGVDVNELIGRRIDPMVRNATISYTNSLRNGDDFICTITIERKGIRYLFHQTTTRVSDNVICASARIEIAYLINGKVAKPELLDNIFAEYIKWV